ncbi:MAG: dihydrodipicolinate synthase family protein, partial [Ferruginibacter sp.]
MIWKGIFPALTTKFTSNDELDIELFAKNLSAQMDAGVHGIVLGGTLGEASVLSITEKKQLVKFAVAATAGKIP